MSTLATMSTQPDSWPAARDRANTLLRIAHQAEHLASVVSGFGEYGLANQLWAFEARMKAEASLARADLARSVLAHEVRPSYAQLHDLRRHGLMTRAEFEAERERFGLHKPDA